MNELDGCQNDEGCGGHDENLEEQRHPVDDEHAGEQGAGNAGEIEPGEGSQGHEEAGNAQVRQIFLRQARE